ncbi:MAG: hypothetical protein QOE70_2934 [Chthoniobacter sp.]|jgi:hypothetical protein|nr:hypothetical protein [Chthoniobacter sp.]
MRPRLITTLLIVTAATLHAAGKPTEIVTQTPGLVAFWTFGEEAGQPRASTGTKETLPLEEVGGPITRAEGGPFSGYSAQFDGQHYFHIPHAQTGGLNISCKDAQVGMFAVVKVSSGKTIAGIWSEGKGFGDDSGTRQYAMLMDMPTYGGPKKLTPHISSEGGVTCRADGSKFPWCADYAAGRTELPKDQWMTLGFTYEGQFIRAYFNGALDAQDFDPVKQKRTDPYFTTEGPSGGPRGINPYYHGRGIFHYDAARHATTKIEPSDFTVGSRLVMGGKVREALVGQMAGLAVFNRALTDEEMKKLHDAAGISALK